MDSTCALSNIAMTIAYYLKDGVDREELIIEAMGGKCNDRQFLSRVYNAITSKKNKDVVGWDPEKIPIYEKEYKLNQKFNFDLVKSEIDKDNPVIMLYSGGSFGHFITITGYEVTETETYIYYNDSGTGTAEKKLLSEMDKYQYDTNAYAYPEILYVPVFEKDKKRKKRRLCKLKKIILIMLFYIMIMGANTVYAGNDDDFIKLSEKIQIELVNGDNKKTLDSYCFNGYHFVNVNDFISVFANKYESIDYVDEETGQNYVAKFMVNDQEYKFWKVDVTGEINGVNIGNAGFEKIVDGKTKDIFLSWLSHTGYINIKGEHYVYLTSIPCIYNEFGYMVKIDLDAKQIVIKPDYMTTNELYSIVFKSMYKISIQNSPVDSYENYLFILKDDEETMFKIKEHIEQYKGMTDDNYKEMCSLIMKRYYGINFDKIKIKYNVLFDAYIVTVNDYTYDDSIKTVLESSEESKDTKMLAIRKFDGRIFYLYDEESELPSFYMTDSL